MRLRGRVDVRKQSAAGHGHPTPPGIDPDLVHVGGGGEGAAAGWTPRSGRQHLGVHDRASRSAEAQQISLRHPRTAAFYPRRSVFEHQFT
jgi:hypothetical protein